eukprot:scaffold2871_cov381-Prasinococcus_capsulatus_cf.AAC.5
MGREAFVRGVPILAIARVYGIDRRHIGVDSAPHVDAFVFTSTHNEVPEGPKGRLYLTVGVLVALVLALQRVAIVNAQPRIIGCDQQLTVVSWHELQTGNLLSGAILASSASDVQVGHIRELAVLDTVEATCAFVRTYDRSLGTVRKAHCCDHFPDVYPILYLMIRNIPEAQLLVQGSTYEVLVV